MRASITGTALYAPPAVETHEEVAARLGVTPDWVAVQTGVLRRHVAHEPVERMAAEAARGALVSGPPPDLVLYASATARQTIPDSSVFVQRELGLAPTAGWSVHATCLSFLVGTYTAYALVSAGAYRRVLVVSSEIASVGRVWTEPESAALLGDGAAAAVVEPAVTGESALLAWEFLSWPEHAELARLEGGATHRHPNDPATRPDDNLFHMNGPALYKAARKRVAVVVARLLDRAGLKKDQISLVVPHQPSGPAVAALTHYGFPPERVVNIIPEYGNCIAASIPMALAVANQEGRLRRGDLVLLLGTGAGLSVGGMILRW